MTDNLSEPQAGEYYKHFGGKNQQYKIVAVARDVNNPNQKVVIYESLYESSFPSGTIWMRSLDDFVGFKTLEDGTKVKRFTKVE